MERYTPLFDVGAARSCCMGVERYWPYLENTICHIIKPKSKLLKRPIRLFIVQITPASLTSFPTFSSFVPCGLATVGCLLGSERVLLIPAPDPLSLPLPLDRSSALCRSSRPHLLHISAPVARLQRAFLVPRSAKILVPYYPLPTSSSTQILVLFWEARGLEDTF